MKGLKMCTIVYMVQLGSHETIGRRVHYISLDARHTCTTIICTICTPCTHLLLQIRIGPRSQKKLNNLLVAIEAGCFQGCPAILYDRMSIRAAK